MEEKFSISYNQADPRDPRGWTSSEFNSRLGLTEIWSVVAPGRGAPAPGLCWEN